MRMFLAMALFISSALPCFCQVAPKPKELMLNAETVQSALIQYMSSHSDCFAGFTPGLAEAAKNLQLSPDRRTLYVGQIRVDLRAATYEFQHWSPDAAEGPGIDLIWTGNLRALSDGSVEVEPPVLTEEQHSWKK